MNLTVIKNKTENRRDSENVSETSVAIRRKVKGVEREEKRCNNKKNKKKHECRRLIKSSKYILSHILELSEDARVLIK